MTTIKGVRADGDAGMEATRTRTRPRKTDRYTVKWVPIDSIKPSPENDTIYGEIEHDAAMDALIDSIDRKGLDQPLLLTADGFILDGHRRYYALCFLGWKEVPILVDHTVKREGNPNYLRDLADHNTQRIKTVGSLFREALLRNNDTVDSYAAVKARNEAPRSVDADFMVVTGSKEITPISDRRQEFLEAVQRVIEDMEDYHPLSIRQIHYRLLNNPPLKQTPKRSKFGPEHYRYKNDKDSYNSLVDLLHSARYLGQVSMSCIDDPTRPQKTWGGWESVAEFVQDEVDGFLTGFHRDRQQDQPRHIEVFGEKNTLYQMVYQVCREYYVPFSLGRGFCSTPVWQDMERRFRLSGKDRMTLIVISDYDPEGFSLADDAIRSLALHGIEADGHRIVVTREQIEELGLAEDFNPAKVTSSRYNEFVKRTGGDRTWECEALPPDYLVEQLKAAIEANMDMEVYEAICDQEEEDREELSRIREEIAEQLEF